MTETGSLPKRANGADELLPEPVEGRIFRADRRVRLGDVDPVGRLRLDACARYLQDVATDDSDDLGQLVTQAWVVRRTVIEQRRAARIDERLALSTYCTGLGSRWAERRVAMVGSGGAQIDAVTLWVHLDPESGRPKTLPAEFRATYSVPSAGREVSARQLHDPVGPDVDGAATFGWLPRATDLDVLDHVNNAIAWSVVEQVHAAIAVANGWERGDDRVMFNRPFRAEVEFREATSRTVVDNGEILRVVHRCDADDTMIALWSADQSTVFMTAKVSPLL
jgi:acyl-ACP thioesterase